MDCNEFQAYVTDKWSPGSPLAEGAPAAHVKICRRCAELFALLENCPVPENTHLAPSDAAETWEKISEALREKRASRSLRFLPVAAGILLAIVLGAFMYTYAPFSSTQPEPKEPKKLEMYVQKAGEPQSKALYLYLEVH